VLKAFTAAHTSWPPRNPANSSEDLNNTLALPPSPWTYENGSLNPTLEPSNSRLRCAASIAKKRRLQDQDSGKLSLPPYHPDYDGSNVKHASEDDGDSPSADSNDAAPFVRGGSEGYEVQSVDREELLKRYLMEVGQEPGRYHRYVPSSDSDSDEEHLPLSQNLKDS
jgi:palmitoyltransferase